MYKIIFNTYYWIIFQTQQKYLIEYTVVISLTEVCVGKWCSTLHDSKEYYRKLLILSLYGFILMWVIHGYYSVSKLCQKYTFFMIVI